MTPFDEVIRAGRIDRAARSDEPVRTDRADRPVRARSGTDDADPAGERHFSVDDVRQRYAEYAGAIRRFERVDRWLTGRARGRQFGDVDGRVLDVACGTGTNFRYLPSTVDLVGVDVSPEMLAAADRRLSDLELEGTVMRMDAQDLAFPDDSFDAVISSLSTCTFPDPVAALREMERVCRPSGTIRLLEHGRSDAAPIARFQEWRADAHYEKMGCRWTQEPLALVDEAGLSVTDVRTAWFGVLTAIEARPRDEARPGDEKLQGNGKRPGTEAVPGMSAREVAR